MINTNIIMIRYLYDNQLTGTIPTALHSHQYEYLYLINGGSGSGNNFCPLISYSSWMASGYTSDTDSPSNLTCNACVSFTCQNGGTCSGGINQLFNCTCATGFSGANCELCKKNKKHPSFFVKSKFCKSSFLYFFDKNI